MNKQKKKYNKNNEKEDNKKRKEILNFDIKIIITNIILILKYLNLLLLISSFIIFILFYISFFKDAQNVIDNNTLNYDIAIQKNDLSKLNLNLEELITKNNLEKYTTFKLSDVLVIKTNKNDINNYKFKLVEFKDINLNLLNTETKKTNLNLDKDIALKLNIKNNEELLLKNNIFQDLTKKVNTNFNLKHPLFQGTNTLFLNINEENKNNKNISDNIEKNDFNIIYLEVKDKKQLDNIINYIKEIDKEKNIYIYSNPVKNAKQSVIAMQYSLIIAILIYIAAYIIISIIYKILNNKKLSSKNDNLASPPNLKINERINEKENKKILNNIFKLIFTILISIILGLTIYNIFLIYLDNIKFRMGIYIKDNKSYMVISIIISFISLSFIKIINSLHNKIKLKFKNK